MNLIAKNISEFGRKPVCMPFRQASVAAAAAMGLIASLAICGCQTKALPPIPPPAPATSTTNSPTLLLHEGDVLLIKYPGAPEMDTQQTIRGDGKITIANAGDVKVSGLTPDGAGQAILGVVGDQLRIKQVSVTVQSSAFIVYITGSVLRPGKLVSDRPLTVFQAVIDAGIDPTKSNLAKVKVIRIDSEGNNSYKMLNLERIIVGEEKSEPFTLKPNDTIVVPEKFSLF